MPMITMKELLEILPQTGKVTWIGLRIERRGRINIVQEVRAVEGLGLEGDRYSGRSGKRGVTLIQQEHLAVVSSLLSDKEINPETLRRNICVSGINLLALKGKVFMLGDAVLEYTGLCHPCSRMEEVLGVGGYNAMRGHGGINARIIKSGSIKLNDSLAVKRDYFEIS